MIYRVLGRGSSHTYLFDKDEKDKDFDAFEEKKGTNQ